MTILDFITTDDEREVRVFFTQPRIPPKSAIVSLSSVYDNLPYSINQELTFAYFVSLTYKSRDSQIGQKFVILAQDETEKTKYTYEIKIPAISMILINDDTLKGENYRDLQKFELEEEYKEFEINVEYVLQDGFDEA